MPPHHVPEFMRFIAFLCSVNCGIRHPTPIALILPLWRPRFPGHNFGLNYYHGLLSSRLTPIQSKEKAPINMISKESYHFFRTFKALYCVYLVYPFCWTAMELSVVLRCFSFCKVISDNRIPDLVDINQDALSQLILCLNTTTAIT